jgi:thymidylate synthase
MMISAWNVDEIKDMALPPCHYSCQFYTKKMALEERVKWFEENIGPYEYGENYELLDEWGVPRRKLSCMWNQRSVDTLLGLPFNIVSYAILTHIIAKVCGMDVDELIFNGGDCHVYVNQIDTYEKEQRHRNTQEYLLPRLMLPDDIDIDNLKYEDIKIEGYESYPPIKYPLSVGL